MTEVLTPDSVRTSLKKVIDPEIQANIVDLGLVYTIDVDSNDAVVVNMTLTTPHCPLGPEIVENVEKTVREEGAQSVKVNIVWEPMWTPDRMTDELKEMLGIVPEPPLEIDTPPPSPSKKKKKGLLSRLFGG